MKTIHKWLVLLLMLWTPLFFGGAAYAATQMQLANLLAHDVTQAEPACHDMDTTHSVPDGSQHAAESVQCKHCHFCASFAAPFNEIGAHFFPQMPALAYNAKWVSSTRNTIPDHRPPIDA